MEKVLNVENENDVIQKVSDVQVVGNTDLFQLICKASSKEQGWMKSTKAMEVVGGCVVQVSTQQFNHVAEAVCFVPNVRIMENEKGKYLDSI